MLLPFNRKVKVLCYKAQTGFMAQIRLISSEEQWKVNSPLPHPPPAVTFGLANLSEKRGLMGLSL